MTDKLEMPSIITKPLEEAEKTIQDKEREELAATPSYFQHASLIVKIGGLLLVGLAIVTLYTIWVLTPPM